MNIEPKLSDLSSRILKVA